MLLTSLLVYAKMQSSQFNCSLRVAAECESDSPRHIGTIMSTAHPSPIPQKPRGTTNPSPEMAATDPKIGTGDALDQATTGTPDSAGLAPSITAPENTNTALVNIALADTEQPLPRGSRTHKRGLLIIAGAGLAGLATLVSVGPRLAFSPEDTDPSTSTLSPSGIDTTPSAMATPNTTPKPTDMPTVNEVPIKRNADGAKPTEIGSFADSPKPIEQLIPHPATMPESVVEFGAFANLTEGQQEWMKSVSELSPEEFLALPRRDRVSFGWVIAQSLVYITQDYRARLGSTRIPYRPDATTVPEIIDNHVILSIAARQAWEDRGLNETPRFNEVASLAVFELVSDRPGPEALRSWKDRFGQFLGDDGYRERMTPTDSRYSEREVTSSYPALGSDGTVVETRNPNTGDRQKVIISSGEKILAPIDTDNPNTKRGVVGNIYPITKILDPNN